MIRSLAIVLALLVSGCAGLFDPSAISLLQGGTSLTAVINNPIDKKSMYDIEAAYATATRAAVAYYRLPQCRKSETESLTNPCSRYMIKVKIRIADAHVRSILVPMRQFVAANDTVSVASLASSLRTAITEYRSVILSAGVVP